MNWKPGVVTILALGLAGPSSGAAGTARTSMSVTVTVPPICVASPLAISAQSYIAKAWKIESALSVACNAPTPYRVGIAHPWGGVGLVDMKDFGVSNLTFPRGFFGSTLRPAARGYLPTASDANSSKIPFKPYLSRVQVSDAIMISITY